MLFPGIVSVTFRNHPYSDVIALASEAGLSAIEWSEGWHVEADDPASAREIGRQTREAGLAVAEYGSYYRLGKGMDIVPRLRNAEALGTDTVRIWGGTEPSAALSPEDRAALVREAREIARTASSAGISIVLEWHRNTVMDGNLSGLSFIEDAGMDNLRTLWQPLQALSVEERADGLGMLGRLVRNLHVFHWVGDERRPLEEGLDAWRRYLEKLDPSSGRYALLEFVKDDSEAQFFEDAASLRAIAAL